MERSKILELKERCLKIIIEKIQPSKYVSDIYDALKAATSDDDIMFRCAQVADIIRESKGSI